MATQDFHDSRPSRGGVHRLFLLSLVLKGIDGLLELVGGAALLLVTTSAINGLLVELTEGEIAEDPHDRIANAILGLGRHLSLDSKRFAGIYLLGHGAVKVFLVVGLLRGKRWAYPTAIAVMLAFVAYQSYRLRHRFSAGLAVLTAFDVVIVVLIYLEYRRSRAAPDGASLLAS